MPTTSLSLPDHQSALVGDLFGSESYATAQIANAAGTVLVTLGGLPGARCGYQEGYNGSGAYYPFSTNLAVAKNTVTATDKVRIVHTVRGFDSYDAVWTGAAVLVTLSPSLGAVSIDAATWSFSRELQSLSSGLDRGRSRAAVVSGISYSVPAPPAASGGLGFLKKLIKGKC